MIIKFKEVKTLNECVVQATQHTNHNIEIKSSGVRDLVNQRCIDNRIAQYAVIYYIHANYYAEDVVYGADRCNHYGVKEGTVLIKHTGMGKNSNSKRVKLLIEARKLVKQGINKCL